MSGGNSERRKMEVLAALESNVRSCCYSFPATFSRARGSILLTETGRKVIDFFAGAGALNYGHNNHEIRSALTDYLAADAVVHGLYMDTPAKLKFMETFSSIILRGRNLKHRFYFTGPTDANAVDAALRFSRKITGRQNIISFSNGHHGMAIRAIAEKGNRLYRAACNASSSAATSMPYDGCLGDTVDTADYLRKMLIEESSGIDSPAAILVETVRGNGGVSVASKEWLQSVQAIAKNVGALFIIDDILMGCGRTGEFFSFEFAALSPDIIIMSKSLSAYGLPLSMLLIKEELDAWRPGEHTDTFPGDNLALVSATAAINLYWRSPAFSDGIQRMGRFMRRRLEAISSEQGASCSVRGRGMALGLDCQMTEIAEAATRKAFEKGLMVERCRSADQVVKFWPPLTIDCETLSQGLEIFEESLFEALRER
ncbi:diaminobutyrate--2-oxoglutarate transaminase [Bradyrhizobium sp. INPA03-11B]|uniref:diaminobutyrate--2-oxoglutarate transaminase n=1 Tax=Bradyrhizobium sp. INPA03-11B TaxID=418598 RepID=UPI00338FD365